MTDVAQNVTLRKSA